MTQRIVSYSEISSFRQCPHKHMLGYRERWQTETRSPALAKGTLFHSVMEQHYTAVRRMQRGKVERADLSAYIMKKISPLLWNEGGDQNEVQELVHWMYDGYVDHYGYDDDWEIIAIEHAAEVALPTLTGRKSQFKLKVKIDLIARHKETEKLYVWDHKSGMNLPSDKELAIDDQFGLYTWAMRQLGRKVWGSLYNAARTQRNKTEGQTLESRHSRTPLYRTDKELDIIAIEAYLTAKRAYAIKEGLAERAPNTQDCKWKCEFLEPCLAGRKGMDERQFLKDIGFVQNFERH